jgi:hypothetical protein
MQSITGRRYVAISESIDVYAGGVRLGSITKVRDQWVPVCAHPDLATVNVKPNRPRLHATHCCGARLAESSDPVTAKSRLILHHGDHHDLNAEAA